MLEIILPLIYVSIDYTVLIQKEDCIAKSCDLITSQPCMTAHFESVRTTIENRTIDKACNHDVLPASFDQILF